MPFLDDAQVQDLLSTAELHTHCRECGHHTAMDYCRTCDEFYWIHQPGCAMYETEHFGHRLTIIPYVEDRGGGLARESVAEPQCMFFANGVTAVLRDGRQQSNLQQSWLELFAEYLESRGQDPATFLLILPDGKEARFFRTTDGWSWRFVEVNN